MINSEYFLSHFIAMGLKASSIAKIIRNESSLFNTLIEEKHSTEYLQFDYKTFADVLIQETVRYDLEMLHSGLSEHLFGEENNEFTNKLNVTIKLKIGKNKSETKELISKVLDGQDNLVSKLVSLIYGNIIEYIDEKITRELRALQDDNIQISDLGIWIDPIDSTSEYINGVGLTDNDKTDCHKPSIKNVTVLMGAFSLQTGIPFAGVVYQPFFQQDNTNNWKHTCFWGITTSSRCLFSNNILSKSLTFPAFAVTSSREVNFFNTKLNIKDDNMAKWNVLYSSGAGFKFLQIFDGTSNCYILSKGSTYKWDTCGPHAILMALGGGVVDYQRLIEDFRSRSATRQPLDTSRHELIRSLLSEYQLRYSKDDINHCNSNGFLAYSNIDVAISVVETLMLNL